MLSSSTVEFRPWSEETWRVESSRWKRILLAAATALLAFAGLGAWAIASPVGAAPDDDFHLASIWCALGDREGLCAPGDEAGERTVPERLIESSRCFASEPQQSAQCPLDDDTRVSTSRGNFYGNYPPVFYSVMSIFAGPDVALSTVLMRLFNAALFVGVVSAIIALLKPGQRGPLIWASIVPMVPLGLFLIPSVNPSSWAVLAGLTVWLATYGYFTAETRGRRISLGVIAAVTAVMGAGARGDSAVFVAFAAFAAALLAFNRNRSWVKLALLPLGIAIVGAAFFLSAGQSTGIAAVGATAPSATDTGAGTVDAAVPAETPGGLGLLLANLMDLPFLWTGGAGTWGLGWLDTPMPVAVWVLMIGLLVAVIFWGVRVMTVRKGIVMVLALLALTVMPLYILQGKGLRVGEWVQPRYLLPLLLIFVGVALFGYAKDHLGITRLQTGIVFGIVAVANSLALHNNMRRYITGLGDGSGFNLNANIEWWWSMPLSPMVVWFIGSAAFALALAGLFLILYPKGERPCAPLEDRAPAAVLAL